MKICVVSTPIFRLAPPMGTVGYSGLEVLAWQTAKGLAERDHEVYLIAPDGSECPGVMHIPIGPEHQVDEKTAYDKYWKYLPDFDIIIDESWMKWSYILKEEGVLKAPVLGVMHAPVNTMYQTLPRVEKPCFVCISEDQKNHFEALHGIPARRCYNGVDFDYYKPLNIPRTDRFLFLARFSSIKGADIAIEACKQAGVGLDLVGDTTLTAEPDFLVKCQSMADGKQIRIVGPAGRGECVHYFSQAKTLIHANKRFREPFGLAPVEAMGCGCPVVSYDFGAMRETIPHGEDSFIRDTPGYLATSFDELVKGISFFRDNQLHPKQRENVRNWATQFSVEKMIFRYEELCLEALSGGW